MRVYVVSDLHVDYTSNKNWVCNLSKSDYRDDVLIVGGDITDELQLLKNTFRALRGCFKEVLYVPGNHDLWIARGSAKTSLEKFHQVMSLANGEGLVTTPWNHDRLTVVPLLSWYDYSFGKPCDWLRKSWMDFHTCNWEGFDDNAAAVSEFFLGKNEAHFEAGSSVSNEHIVSFSHFLPRIDIMPSRIPPKFQRLYPVLGSLKIDDQVRRLGAHLHIYGHSHVNRDKIIDGVRYINNAFGNPVETRIAKKALQCIYENGEFRSASL